MRAEGLYGTEIAEEIVLLNLGVRKFGGQCKAIRVLVEVDGVMLVHKLTWKAMEGQLERHFPEVPW